MKALIILCLALAVFGAAGYATYRLFIQPEQALKMEKLLPPPPPPPDPTVPEFQKCLAIKKSGKLVPARDALYTFIEQYPESTKAPEAKDLIGELNRQIYLTPFPSPDRQVYIVKPGDVIDRVARHMKTSGEMILRANNLHANTNKGVILQIGQKLSVPQLELSLVISRKQDRVIVLNRGRFFSWYPVVLWPPGLTKKPAAGKAVPVVAKQAGQVTQKMAWLNGQRITYADKGYAESTHWIQINIAHCTLHSVADEKAEGRPPGGGIVLASKAMEELTALLDKDDSVILE